MQTPLRITFRHMEPSAALEALIRVHVARLEHIYHRITGCHVVVESPSAHHGKGAPFAVRIEATVPGAGISAGCERDSQAEHTDVYVALREAFDTLRRRLQEHAEAGIH